MVAAPQAPEADISGYYTSDSMKEGDSFRITPSGESYEVLWRYPAGDWVGVAIREGDTLAIGWHRTDGANLGVSIYKIQKGEKAPTLVGGWAAYPGGRIAKDTLKWSKKLE